MDTFEHRLQQVLEMEEISQAQFADRLGIQRGGLCHLLSGRNKPSFDFIVKLLSSYPDVNPEWLLTGKGKPYKIREKENTLPSTTASENDKPVEIFPEQEIDDLPIADDLFSGTTDSQSQTAETQETTPPNDDFQPRERAVNGNRTIERVMIFFSDGTFEER